MNSPSSERAEEASVEPIGLAVAAARQRQAEGLIVLDLAKVSDFTERFMICSGTNERQVKAIADAIVDVLREHGWRLLHTEGLRPGRWILLDYGGDMVIHVFLDETRKFYGLERLWSDAPDLTDRFPEEPPALASP